LLILSRAFCKEVMIGLIFTPALSVILFAIPSGSEVSFKLTNYIPENRIKPTCVGVNTECLLCFTKETDFSIASCTFDV
jgi:hypothetical protein